MNEMTRKEYGKNIRYFVTFCNKSSYEDLIMMEQTKLESPIRDYIIYLRHGKKLSPATVSSYIAPVAHFFEMNDITIKWKKLKKFKAKHRSIVEDKPYTREQIKTLVDLAHLETNVSFY